MAFPMQLVGRPMTPLRWQQSRSRFLIRAVVVGFALVLVTLITLQDGLKAFAQTTPGVGDRQFRSWRVAHEEVKQLDARLRGIISEAGARVRELDKLFNQSDSSAQRSTDFSTSAPLGERAMPDVEANPPILAGGFAAGGAIVGFYSSKLDVPQRMPAAQLLYLVDDDPATSKEENELWKQSLELLVESLEPLWLRMEEVVASVAAAEERAERRRAPVVLSFRERVLKQMEYANDFIPRDELETWLTTLQTDKRLLQYLGLLEQSTLQAEQLQEELNRLTKEAEELPPASEQSYRAQERYEDLASRSRRLDIRIRAACRAAEEMPETMDAYKKLGEWWDSANPFR